MKNFHIRLTTPGSVNFCYVLSLFFNKQYFLFKKTIRFQLISILFILITICGNAQNDLDVVCPDEAFTITKTRQVQFINGVLQQSDEQLELSNYACLSENADPGLHYFNLYSFQVSTTDVYTFIAELPNDDFSAAIFLFENENVALNSPCTNILAQQQLLSSSPAEMIVTAQDRLSLPLLAGKNYSLLLSSLSPAGATGNYNLYAFAENGGSLIGLPATTTTISIPITEELVCMDVNELLLEEDQNYAMDVDGSIVENSLSLDMQIQLNYFGYPTINNNCGLIDISVNDELTDFGDCGDWVINRTFIFTDRTEDNCNGIPDTTECTQMIRIRKPDLDDVSLPPETSFLSCDDDFPTDEEAGGPDDNPHPSITGYPFIITTFGYQELMPDQCTIRAYYSDEARINICESSYKYRREWSLINWCSPGDSLVFDQLINVGDTISPIIQIPIPDYDGDGISEEAFMLSVSSFDCSAQFGIPTAIVTTDECSGVEVRIVTIYASSGELVWTGAEGTLITLPIDNYSICWYVEDACINKNTSCVDLIIRDAIPPAAICAETVNVWIGAGDVTNGQQGNTRMAANQFDGGSTDNCSPLQFEVRRNFWNNDSCHENPDQWSPWQLYADFYCCDINTEINIELRVIDMEGNADTCEMTVVPQDNLVPVCYAPQDASIASISLSQTFPDGVGAAFMADSLLTQNTINNLFGFSTGTDNCALDRLVELDLQININDCNWGTIVRRFEAWQWKLDGDANGNGVFDREEARVSTNNCTQTITITGSNDYIVDFPQDAIVECGDPCIWDIVIQSDSCDVIAVTRSQPFRYAAEGDECYRMNIVYDVINWSIWDGEYDGYEISRRTENDGDASSLEGLVESSERPVLIGNNNGVKLDRTHETRTICPDSTGGYWSNDESSLVDTNCENDSDMNANLCQGRWSYTQIIKVYDSILPMLTVGQYGGATEDCPDLEAGQFCTPINASVGAVDIPFVITDSCGLFDPVFNTSISLFAAELDLYTIDQNGDGFIDEAEFIAEPGPSGDATEFVYILENGNYSFTGVFPAIADALGEEVSHAARVTFVDGCGNQTTEIIHFDVVSEIIDAVKSPFESGFKLFQNQPNPLTQQTLISFNLPNNSYVNLSFRDINGRLVHTINGDYLAGRNTIIINRAMLQNSTGVITYSISTGQYIATGKMIVVD